VAVFFILSILISIFYLLSSIFHVILKINHIRPNEKISDVQSLFRSDAEVFEMYWWLRVGSSIFPDVAIVFHALLTMPGGAAQLERDFSMCEVVR
jgi:hypothetical protein